jgi:hypothetical protein
MDAPANGRPPGEAVALQRLVMSDPVVLKYLEEENKTPVLSRKETLSGYECYLVEQWACSRTDPTFVITTFTGDPSRKVVVSILGVPVDEALWSPRLKVYSQALLDHRAKRRETPLGTVMITNISSFPSSLTVIPVPDGDVNNHRLDFLVNENLKRLGCSGRVGLTLSKPSPATAAKFYQLYRVSEKIQVETAVVELVKLCQTALMLFGLLDPQYADGLLCDVTERAINDWWIEIGTEYYSIEPHDGILGPTTVSALLGTLIGARNRLNAYGAPVPKDVFDIESTKRGIAWFQKSHHMTKSRRLDRQTLAKIHRSTAKAASGDGWFVPRAVKSTVAELSGKGGEMVMDMVGARDRAGIAEVETIDIEQFVLHVHGSRSKWLWQGKPRKAGDAIRAEARPGPAFQSAEPSSARSSLQLASSSDRIESTDHQPERNRLAKRPPDRMPGKPSDAGRGLGRIKGAVGLRHHASKLSKDTTERLDHNIGQSMSDPATLLSPGSPESLDARKYALSPLSAASSVSDAKIVKQLSEQSAPISGMYEEHVEPPSDGEPDQAFAAAATPRSLSPSPTLSVDGSPYRDIEAADIMRNSLFNQKVAWHFRRSQSFTNFEESNVRLNEARWPRRLSFGMAEDGLTWWRSAASPTFSFDPATDLEICRRTRQNIHNLETDLAEWVQSQVQKIEDLQQPLARDQDELDDTYYAQSIEQRELGRAARETADRGRDRLDEAARDVEVLGARLEYEINALRGLVEDVEGGVGEYERQVGLVEARVAQLERAMLPKESWAHWTLRMLTGWEMQIGRADGR